MVAFYVYLFCLVVGAVFVLGCALAGNIFGSDGHVAGSGGEAVTGADASDSPGMSAFSPTIIAAFLTSFGGLGVVCSQFKATESPWLSAPISLVGAVIIAGGVLMFLRFLIGKTESSSESKISTVVGMMATVITPIPENAVGEVAYVQAGTRYTAPAREINNRPVANGRTVRVVRIVGSQFYVEECS